MSARRHSLQSIPILSQDISITLFSIKKLDDLLSDLRNRQFNKSSHEFNSQSTEEDETDTLQSHFKVFKGQHSINQIVEILIKTKYESIHLKVFEFYMEALTRPLGVLPKSEDATPPSREETGNTYIIFLQSIIKTYPFFNICERRMIITALANAILLFSPNGQQVELPFRPTFHTFSTIVTVISEIFISYSKTAEDKELIYEFAQNLLLNILKLASNLAPSTNIAHAKYFEQCIIIISAINELNIDRNSDLYGLLQQFWISAVVFSSGDLEPFNAIKKISPPVLLLHSSKSEFASIKIRIMSILKMINPNEWKKTEDLLNEFNQIIPNMNQKTFLSIDLPDVIFMFCIYSLEHLRAQNGSFGPIFTYFEPEYSQSMTFILDSIFEQIYKQYHKYKAGRSEQDQVQSSKELMRVLIEKYSSKSLKIQSLVDQIFKQFVYENPSAIFSVDVLRVLAKSELAFNELPLARQQNFQLIMEQAFSKSTQIAPYAFLACLHHLVVVCARTNFIQMNPSFILPLTQFLPTEFRETFITEFAVKCIIYGEARFATAEQILCIESITDRLLLASSHIVLHPDSSLLPSLVCTASQHLLLMAWSHVAMNASDKSALNLARYLSFAFYRLGRDRKGIFAHEPDEDNNDLQGSIIRFFIEQNSLNKYLEDIMIAILSVYDIPILIHPSIVKTLLPMIYLICTVLTHSRQMATKTVQCLFKFMVKLSLLAFSFEKDPRVFKYVTDREIYFLELIIPTLQQTGINSTRSFFTIERTKSTNSNINNSKLIKELNMKQLSKHAQKSHVNMSHKATKEFQMTTKFMGLIAYLLCDELQIFLSYLNIPISPQVQRMISSFHLKRREMHLTSSLPIIWEQAPESLYAFSSVKKSCDSIVNSIIQFISKDHIRASKIPHLSQLLFKSDKFNPALLSSWSSPEPIILMNFLIPDVLNNYLAASFLVRSLSQKMKEKHSPYIPFIIQAMKYDTYKFLYQYFINLGKNSVLSRSIIWAIKAEKESYNDDTDKLTKLMVKINKRIIENAEESDRFQYQNEINFVKQLFNICKKIESVPKDEQQSSFSNYLSNLAVPENITLPINPSFKITSIDCRKSTPQSQSLKTPILITFNGHPPSEPISYVFSLRKDARIDSMIVEFLNIYKGILNEAGLDAFVCGYHVYAVGKNQSIIEHINAPSRHELGLAASEDLLSYYINKYGQVGTPEFIKAQNNFINSMAPYSIFCYIFQIKNRHNANILIDEEGHIIHVNFTYAFDLSTGNMKFERPPFKLTKEMISLMGGSKDAPAFQKYVQLMLQCFMAVRTRHHEIESLASLMVNAGFPCFKSDSIKKLRQRFFLDKEPKDMLGVIKQLVDDSYDPITTSAFDAYQATTNKIYYF